MAAYKIADQRFFYEPNPDFSYMNLIKCFAWMQFVLEFLTIIHVSYILNIITKTRVCHINLRIVSIVFLVELILKAVTNILVVTKLITGKTFLVTSFGYILANILQCTTNYLYYFFPLSILAERSVSLIWAKKYERFFSLPFITTLCLIPVICAIYFTVHLLLLQEWVPIVYPYYLANGMITSCWTGYFILYFFTKKLLPKHSVQSLSERYQRYENFRANKTMFWFAVASWFSIVTALIYIQILAHYKEFFPSISDVNMNALLRLILDTIQALIFLILPICFMFTNQRLLQKYLEPLSNCRTKSRIYTATSVQSEFIVKSITGENLICINESDQYFKMLATDWGDIFEKQPIQTTSV